VQLHCKRQSLALFQQISFAFAYTRSAYGLGSRNKHTQNESDSTGDGMPIFGTYHGPVFPTIMDLSVIPFQYSLTVEGEYVLKMRLDPEKVSPAAYHAMLGLESFVSKSSKLEGSLLELVKMRASQINGCAFSIDMHSKDARVNGETEQRLYALSAWRETLQRRWE
jgi:AhpD family alkylhydroperoxidase